MPGGILNLSKPRGMTSFAVVSLVRQLTKVRRVGHAGTLDPMAEGVLPICLGQATRIVEYLVGAPKTYRGAVRLGVSTDTHDSEGSVVATADAGGVRREEIETTLRSFVGEIQQVPPLFSALKHRGRPLYQYARAGRTVPREARTVTIYRIDLLRFDPPVVEVELECGRGAYVRTLAHDVGQRLGCGAHLERLTRLRSGPFSIEEATELEEMEDAARRGVWADLLYPADRVLESWHAALLGEKHSLDARHGRSLVLTPLRPELGEMPTGAPCRAYSHDGEFLGILRHRGTGRWHAERVFAAL